MMLLLEYDVPAGQHLPSGQYTVFGRNFNILKFVSVSVLLVRFASFTRCDWLLTRVLILLCALQGMGGENNIWIIRIDFGLRLSLCSWKFYYSDFCFMCRQEVCILSGESWSKGSIKKTPIVTYLLHIHPLCSLPEMHALPIAPQSLLPLSLAANLALGHVLTAPVSTQAPVTGTALLLLWL